MQDADIDKDGARWCILQTTGARTLALATSLTDVGIEAWTPRRTIKRPAPGHRRRLMMGQRKVTVEVDLAIIPGFVFARSSHIPDLLRISAIQHGPTPSFSILHAGDRIPLVGATQVAGLRQEEVRAAAAIQAEREADTREDERRKRALRLGTERAKRKALRQESKALERGMMVTIDNAPALAGMIGRVISSKGTSATVYMGGSLTMDIEAWQIRPVAVQAKNIAA